MMRTARAEDGATAEASSARAALVARQQALLEVMLRQPGNLDIAFEYATISTELGDYEAAISTFERMLIYAPGLPRVQLELGVLYFRLGSLDAARYYFQSALEAPRVPREVEERVQAYLTAINRKERPAEFRGAVVIGGRYQSNANAGPGGRRVSLNGTDFFLDETTTGNPDVNGFVAANLHGAYDLGTQGDLLEADLLVYGARYYDQVRLDTAIAELTAGPSFNLARIGLDNTRVGIYGIFSGVRLNHANYNGALGFGTRFVSAPDPLTSIIGKAEFRRRWYNDTADFPTVSERNGYVVGGTLTVTREVSAAWSVRMLFLADFEEARTDYNQSWEVGAGAGGTYRFASPVKSLSSPWSADLEAGYIFRQYAGPNPLISTTESEVDDEGWVRGVLTVPFRHDFAFALTGELRRVYSNYDLSSYTNASVSVSLIRTF